MEDKIDEHSLYQTQEPAPLPDVSGKAGGGAPHKPEQAKETEAEVSEADSRLQGVLQGAVNVDWTSAADAPRVCACLCLGTMPRMPLLL